MTNVSCLYSHITQLYHILVADWVITPIFIFLLLNAKFREDSIRFHIKGVSEFVGGKYNAYLGQFVGAQNNQGNYNKNV